jgi:inosine/xanthosine triphosphatase
MTQYLFAVASSNPVKLEAARIGASRVFDDVAVIAVSGASNVSQQPVGDVETIAGARSRAITALAAHPAAEFGVGLEGGVIERPEGMYCVAWCAIVDAAGRVGLGSAGMFLLPPRVAELVRSGVELGHADDQVFGRQNSKHKDGAIGVLTGGRMTRAEYYAPMVTLALVRFLNPELY